MESLPHVSLIRVQRFKKVPACVHHAPDLNQSARGFEERIVDRVGIGLQISGVSFQKLRRTIPASRCRVVVDHHRMVDIPNVGPDPPSPRKVQRRV